ncbi:MAG: hypothetical protein COA45_03385 [Zetaproteobacteria bacterium]|nr:MAG: hypothetical protein COA45_03385 [Zetaproteobacteria bacterium]
MSTRNLFASVSLLMCLSGSVFAMDYGMNHVDSNSAIHTIGWDQKSLEAQMQGSVYLRAQIDKLEQQNEQLRNSLSQMRNKKKSGAPLGRDPRIQALIEENKSLSNKLLARQSQNSDRQGGISADVYMQKLYVLEADNQKIKERLAQALTQSGGETSYLKQENARLKASLSALSSSSGTDQQSIVSRLEKEIRSLKSRNVALLSSSASGKTSKATMGKIVSLQNLVQELQGENRKLAQILASSSEQLLGLHKRVDSARNEKSSNTRSVITLKNKLAQSQKNNATLILKVKNLKNKKPSPSVVVNSKGIQALQKQNQSLRETIRAQNDVLVSADNATKTAERLLTENAILKRQLDAAGKVGLSNGKSAKDLFARNETLRSEVKRRDSYIKKLEGLKDTVKQLRFENDKYVMGKVTSDAVNKRFAALQADKQNAESLLKKERQNTTQYRTKIKEYQDKIAGIKNGQSKALASKISDYKSNIVLLEKARDSKDDEIMALQLKNQELKARISLLFETAEIKSNNVSKKNAIVAYARDVEKPVEETNVTLIETKYPPVEQIVPLLDHDGAHRFDKERLAMDGNAAPLMSEQLLSQKLKPLSDM